MTVETLSPPSRARRLFGAGHVAEVVPFKASAAARFHACLKASDNATDPDMRRVWNNHAQAVWAAAADAWPYVPPYDGGEYELDGAAEPGFRRKRDWLPDWSFGVWLTGVLVFCAGFYLGAMAMAAYVGGAMD